MGSWGCFAETRLMFTVKNKYFRFKEKSILPGGELSVASTRHWVICYSKPGVGGIFFLLGPFQFHVLGFSSKVSSVSVHSLG